MMIRKKLLASFATLSVSIAAYTSLDAATLFSPLPNQAEHGVVTYLTQASENFFDYFEEGQQRRSTLDAVQGQTFKAPYNLMVSEPDGSASSLGMLLASLGLMAVIVHRRREL